MIFRSQNHPMWTKSYSQRVTSGIQQGEDLEWAWIRVWGWRGVCGCVGLDVEYSGVYESLLLLSLLLWPEPGPFVCSTRWNQGWMEPTLCQMELIWPFYLFYSEPTLLTVCVCWSMTFTILAYFMMYFQYSPERGKQDHKLDPNIKLAQFHAAERAGGNQFCSIFSCT